MLKLNYDELDFKKAFEYFQDNLIETNTLSSKLINLVDFKKGTFFSFFPEKINFEKINCFKEGGIAKQKEEIKEKIFKELKSNNKLCCVFDDVSATFKPDYAEPLFLNYGLFYEKEIYYLIRPEIASLKLLNECFYVSNAIWHSLCILTEFDFGKKKDKQLKIEEIEGICTKTVLIALGAYDAEGYLFWKAENSKVFSNLSFK
ncbi:hypothetical protein [Candidatus Protochlamydia phocaeensis]|uniref:hypothetical protein n=1 Tax=Candidatus Protochlamydia phocaeensis TaxID=1414722 RepID=UPI000839A149|nr:hypothetical protein [Candidatus Protochlamydia phocaeensis]